MCLKGLYIHKLTIQKGLSHQAGKPISSDRNSYLNPPLPKTRCVAPPVKLGKRRLWTFLIAANHKAYFHLSDVMMSSCSILSHLWFCQRLQKKSKEMRWLDKAAIKKILSPLMLLPGQDQGQFCSSITALCDSYHCDLTRVKPTSQTLPGIELREH